MTETYLKYAYDMLYLTSCALNSAIPDIKKIEETDLKKLFDICQFHSLTGIVYMALESAGADLPGYWKESESKAIRKVILLDAEREKIFAFMEKSGIWYMPLKGVILKEYYPKIGMRQMSDNDILYDIKFREQLKDFMLQNGYQAEGDYKLSYHDEYLKAPVYNFEMHTKLFSDINDVFSLYFSDVKSKLLKDSDNNFGFHFTDEDFYIYITAHEYKHFSLGGTGLRSLADIYVYLKEKGDNLNRSYIDNELEKLGIKDFEQKSCELSKKIFGSVTLPELTPDEKEHLEYYFFSGTYGTFEHRIKNQMQKHIQKTGNITKFSYIMSRIFPDLSYYKLYYPYAYKHKILIPFAWTARLFKGIIHRRKKIKSELKVFKRSN